MLNFDAIIFDLDGVITKTAIVHGVAWKKMFDSYLKDREKEHGEAFKEFTHNDDYLPFVDGKPRYKGVQSFLESRGINIPFGDPEDATELETCCGLGNRKNIFFNQVLENEGVQAYETTIALIQEIHKRGIKVGVASSSKNCESVLARVEGLKGLIETRVDGVVSAEIGLKGKPEPDIFTTACDNLGVEYNRAIIVEDAVSGVQAGKKGNFGLTLGLAREDNIQELRENGADIVVEDIGELTLDDLNNWFVSGLEKDKWSLTYNNYDKKEEKSREALLTVGNGYLGTRGAMMESSANKINYPGTYIHGIFNRLISKVSDRDIENEDLVNLPNWLAVKFKIADNKQFEIMGDPSQNIKKIKRVLNFKTGELAKEMVVEDKKGRLTRIRTKRFVSMAKQHVAGLIYSITPLNYSEQIEISSELRGDQLNAGVERYNSLNNKHLSHTNSEINDTYSLLIENTNSSNITIVEAAKHTISINAEKSYKNGEGWTQNSFTYKAKQGEEVKLEKIICIYTSQDCDKNNPTDEAKKQIQDAEDYQHEYSLSEKIWGKIWNEIDVVIEGDRLAQKLIRLHLYHTISTASPFHKNIDAGICPRGLTGEAYRGHVFWDELFILPFYNIHYPEVSKSVLMYRYRRLDAARTYAKKYGYKGAMFPWQSGSNGREETQIIHLNPLSGKWGTDYSSLQRHVSIAIAYNIWNYFWATKDVEFLANYGAEIFLEICRFWASKSKLDNNDGRYHIDKVMGPDEFHETLPGSNEEGLTDNAYTNIMVSWLFRKINDIFDILSKNQIQEIKEKIKLNEEEIKLWQTIKSKLALNINKKGIIEQFKGYFGLEELDWDGYRQKYHNIHRLDRILKAEGKSPDNYKLSKQADLLMTFYNLPLEEITSIIKDMGYNVPDDYLRNNFEYYIARTSHGSTLSKIVHSSLALKVGNPDLAWSLYIDALKSDLIDVQGGTTGEGIHCGVMTGTVNAIIRDFCQFEFLGEKPNIKTVLPSHWKSLKLNFTFQNKKFEVK